MYSSNPIAWLYTNVQSGDVEVSDNPDHREDPEMWHSRPIFDDTELLRQCWRAMKATQNADIGSFGLRVEALAALEKRLNVGCANSSQTQEK